MLKHNKYDCIIIGGGFFGAYIAIYLRQKYKKILLIEQENNLLLHASINNQARVHNGYHYPRSLSTAISSHRHFKTFCNEFSQAIQDDFIKYYAIASIGSKTSSTQFYRLFKQFNIFIESAPIHIKAMFNPKLISDVFCTHEYAFNTDILRTILQDRLEIRQIEIALNAKANCVREDKKGLCLDIEFYNCSITTIHANIILNCTYAGINNLLINSNLPLLPLKYEMTEMALVNVKEDIQNLAFTVMDGEFFSLMPYPIKNCYTLSHVRYTPHFAWQDMVDKRVNPYNLLHTFKRNAKSNFPFMLADCKRYMPLLESLAYIDSLYEIKTLQVQNEIDDGRPIIFAKDYGLKGFCVIMGGKIDNIYEIIELLNV